VLLLPSLEGIFMRLVISWNKYFLEGYTELLLLYDMHLDFIFQVALTVFRRLTQVITSTSSVNL
jgi:hypothetical protein